MVVGGVVKGEHRELVTQFLDNDITFQYFPGIENVGVTIIY